MNLMSKLFKARHSTKQTSMIVIAVSGLPRSGTSLVMHMLAVSVVVVVVILLVSGVDYFWRMEKTFTNGCSV